MIKGAQKNMIVVKTADSPHFEEAYFVMRTRREAEASDMMAEANRIIEAYVPEGRRGRRKGPLQVKLWQLAILFCGGLLCGGSGVLLLTFLM